jgi:hypothetical protein
MDIRPDLPSGEPPVRPNESDEDYPVVRPSNARPTSGLAIGFGAVSLVIGLLAVFFSVGLGICCFLLGWMTVPFSAIGLVLGIIGLVIPLATKSRGIALPIAGTCVNALALLIVLASQVFGFAFISRGTPAQPTVVSQSEPNVVHEKPAPIDTVTEGDVKLTILKVQRQPDQLVIHVQVQNLSKRNKATFKTWSVPKENGQVNLVDEAMKEYVQWAVDGVANQKGEQTILPNNSLEDVLVFEAPPENFDTLILQVPAANFGGNGRIRFVIPHDKVQK